MLWIILLSPIAFAWWGQDPYIMPPVKKDHGKLTDQSLSVVENNDTLSEYKELVSLSNKFFIKFGSDYLDFSEYWGGKPKNKPGYINSSVSHFYHPNGSSYNDQWPSAYNDGYAK